MIQYNNKIMLLEGDSANGTSALGRLRGAPGPAEDKTNVGYYHSVGLNHRSARLASDKLPAYLKSQSGRKAGQSCCESANSCDLCLTSKVIAGPGG